MIIDGKKVKTVMKDFTIDEISAVDRPAQTHARVTIMKRDNSEGLAKFLEGSVALTTETDGHSHLIVLGHGESILRAGSTDFNDNHFHPWLVDNFGQIIIGSADDHVHDVQVISKSDDAPDSDMLAAAGSKDDASNDKAADAIGTQEDQSMTQKSTKAADDATAANPEHEAEIAKLTKRAERAEQVAELSDAHRVFFKSLKTEDADTFLAKSGEDRAAEVQAASEANKVIYKAEDGTQYRKNDDPRLVALAKSSDSERKKRFDFEEKAKKAELEKRAAELTHIPDKDGARVALLKAIDLLPEDEQKAAMAALNAQNERLAGAFKTAGTSAAPNPDSDQEDELDAMAKKIAERDSITFEQAYAKALETPEGTALYTKSLEAQQV